MLLKGNEVVAEHQVRGNGPEKLGINSLFAQIDKRNTVAFREPTSIIAVVLLFRAEDARGNDRIVLCGSHMS